MLIPLRHENMEGRRWPVVTFALIALNILVFLYTHWKMEEQAPERAEVRMHVIILAGIHPELKKTQEVQQFVDEVQNKVPEQFWKQLSSPNRKVEDSWDARIRLRPRVAPSGNGWPGRALYRGGEGLNPRQLRLRSGAPEAYNAPNLYVSSYRLASFDRQYVVSVARRLHSRG